MQVIDTDIPDVKILVPKVFGDERGFFLESWNLKTFTDLGLPHAFVQDNHSRSARGTLRGLHYQLEHAQGKLVRAVVGEVFDVAVDLRRSSQTFGRWVGHSLSAENRRQIWIPPGFAHGFYVVSEFAEVLYKTTDFYDPGSEHTVLWSDPQLGVRWPIGEGERPILSSKDAAGIPFAQAPHFS